MYVIVFTYEDKTKDKIVHERIALTNAVHMFNEIVSDLSLYDEIDPYFILQEDDLINGRYSDTLYRNDAPVGMISIAQIGAKG